MTFEEVFSFHHLYESYKKCCMGVGWKSSTQTYRANAIYNVAKTHTSLMTGSFKSKGFVDFWIYERGKPRHIRSVHISERVVQRCLCDYALTPMLGRSFIYDNGASTKNKGMSFSVKRLKAHLRRHWLENENDGYVLLFDIHHYFDSIPHAPLSTLLNKYVYDNRIIKLSEMFIGAFGNIGLGLGSQISQICALAFLSGLDHYIKEKLGIKYYGRYMDDGYLIHADKAYLTHCAQCIDDYCNSLGVMLNTRKTQIVRLSRGFTILKTRFSVTKNGGVIRRIGRLNITIMRRKLKAFKRKIDSGEMIINDVETAYRSWVGCAKQCKSFRTVKEMNLLYDRLFIDEGVSTCTRS